MMLNESEIEREKLAQESFWEYMRKMELKIQNDETFDLEVVKFLAERIFAGDKVIDLKKYLKEKNKTWSVRQLNPTEFDGYDVAANHEVNKKKSCFEASQEFVELLEKEVQEKWGAVKIFKPKKCPSLDIVTDEEDVNECHIALAIRGSPFLYSPQIYLVISWKRIDISKVEVEYEDPLREKSSYRSIVDDNLSNPDIRFVCVNKQYV